MSITRKTIVAPILQHIDAQLFLEPSRDKSPVAVMATAEWRPLVAQQDRLGRERCG